MTPPKGPRKGRKKPAKRAAPKKAPTKKAATKAPQKAPSKKAEPKRAHEDDGTFRADDPKTPEVNEAFEAVPEEEPKKEPKKAAKAPPPPPPPPKPPLGVGYIPRPAVYDHADPAASRAVALATDTIPVFRLPTTPLSLFEGWRKVVDLASWDGPPGAWLLFLLDNMEIEPAALDAVRTAALANPNSIVCLRGIRSTGARFELDWWSSDPHKQLGHEEASASAYPYEGGFAAPVALMADILEAWPVDHVGGFEGGTNVLLAQIARSHGAVVVLAEGDYRLVD